jgi:hypothetical protein
MSNRALYILIHICLTRKHGWRKADFFIVLLYIVSPQKREEKDRLRERNRKKRCYSGGKRILCEDWHSYGNEHDDCSVQNSGCLEDGYKTFFRNVVSLHDYTIPQRESYRMIVFKRKYKDPWNFNGEIWEFSSFLGPLYHEGEDTMIFRNVCYLFAIRHDLTSQRAWVFSSISGCALYRKPYHWSTVCYTL